MIFLDTCILIDHSKDKLILDLSGGYCTSSIVKMEFKAGARDKRELQKLNRILGHIKCVQTDQDILDLAECLIERYTLSHGMGIYDAIIAATCMVYDLPLWTFNQRDFRFIDGLLLEQIDATDFSSPEQI